MCTFPSYRDSHHVVTTTIAKAMPKQSFVAPLAHHVAPQGLRGVEITDMSGSLSDGAHDCGALVSDATHVARVDHGIF